MRKILLVLSVSCFLFLSFSGCTSKQTSESEATLTIWHWMSDREEAFQELAKKYEVQTGVRIRFELYAPSGAYSQKIMVSAQGKALPDIYGLLGEKRLFAAFIGAGHTLDLTAFMKEDNNRWQDSFFDKALQVNEFLADNSYGINPGIYGVPIDVTNVQMLYNKKLLRQLGLGSDGPPRDWGEFISIADKLKGTNFVGLVSGWSETWMIDCFASNYAFNIMGEKKVIATIAGEISYTDPDWLKVLGLFKQLADSGMIDSNIVTMGNKTAEQLFANERALFAFNGSWCVNVYKGMNPDLEYAVFMPPPFGKFPMRIWGGAGSSFLVNARSEQKQKAVHFLKWLTAKEQQGYLAKTTLNLPANKESLMDLPPILAQFVSGMKNAIHPNVLPVQELPLVIEALDKGIQGIIIGVKTPQEIAEEVQEVKDREMRKVIKK